MSQEHVVDQKQRGKSMTKMHTLFSKHENVYLCNKIHCNPLICKTVYADCNVDVKYRLLYN